MFAGSGRVMLTDLTDLCDEEEVKSVYQLQDRGKKRVCPCTKLLIGLTNFSGGVLYQQRDGISIFYLWNSENEKAFIMYQGV
jgi:hypothetical protein